MLSALTTVAGLGAAGLAVGLNGGCNTSTGLASYGCISVTPPVFLTEAEARAVIIDEAKKAGIHFQEGGPTYPSVAVKAVQGGKTAMEVVKADGYDPAKHVAFVFVSKERMDRWAPDRKSPGQLGCQAVAFELQDKIRDAYLKDKVATFTEPFEMALHDEQKAMEREREDLRQQVRDFVRWLTGQGVL